MNKQRVLIVGKKARDHALAWKIAQSPELEKLYIAPGNGGTAEVGENVAIAMTDTLGLVKFASENKVDLTVVSQDDAVAAGIVDAFQAAGLRIFGATKAAAEIEWSKAFSKELMLANGIPTAASKTFSDYGLAVDYLTDHQLPLVIKASGLAGGKGVVICRTLIEAKLTLQNMMAKQLLGPAGETVVIEEFLEGPEISLHAITDGKVSQLWPITQDHKAVGEGETGPNTGGMGAYGPVEGLGSKFAEEMTSTVIEPVLKALNKQGRQFMSCLYPGLKLTADGPKVLEYNARFGDPEAQVYMRLLETDLLEILNACVDGRLSDVEIKWKPGFAVCVVLASAGYPGEYRVGRPIYGLDKAHVLPEVVVFQDGTKRVSRRLVTAGGRVLSVTAVGATLKEAIKKAYDGVDALQFQGMHYRKDIGAKGLESSKAN